MKKSIVPPALVAAVVFALTPSLVKGQVIANPGFENQPDTDWTVTGIGSTSIDISPFFNMSPSPAGFWSAYVKANNTANTLSQNIIFTSAGTFQISFLSVIMDFDTPSAPQLNVSFSGGLYSQNFTVSEIAPSAARAFSSYTGSPFTVSTPGTYTLTFAPAVGTTGDDIWIDNVQIIPEPSTVLLLSGALLGLAIRRRRR